MPTNHGIIKFNSGSCENTQSSPKSQIVTNVTKKVHPRERLHQINLHSIAMYDQDISPLSNLRFADTTEFPQEIRELIEADPDLLVDYHIYPEYYPYIAVDTHQEYIPQMMPPSVETIYNYIISTLDIDSPLNQSQPFFLDID